MSIAIRNIKAVFKRELTAYFTSPIAYVIIVIFLLMAMGFAFWIGNLWDFGDASLTWTFFFYLPFFFVVLAPAVGMRLWSDEHRDGTIELMLTMPIEPWHAILGKFLASAVVWAVALLFTWPIVWTIQYLGDPDLGFVLFDLKLFKLRSGGPILSGYLGAFLYASSCVAITMAISAFTRSQVTCLIISVALCLALTLIGYPQIVDQLMKMFPAGVVDTIADFSLMSHFLDMTKGVLVFRDLLYFLSVIVVSLVITSIAIRAKRA